MSFYLKLAFRNIFRQRKRSILTILTIFGSFVLCSVAIGLVYGTYGKVINTFTQGHSGHVQVHTKGFLERPSLFKNIRDREDVERMLSGQQDIVSFTPRVFASVLISAGEKTTGGKIIGVDPNQESKTTTIFKNLKLGQLFSTSPSNEIVIGHTLSQILSVQLGNEIILMTQAADGSTSNDKFRVVGILNEEKDPFEARNIYLHIKTAQDFLALGDRIHEYAIVLKSYDLANSFSKKMSLLLTKYEVTPWQEIESEFYKAMKADQTGIWLDLGIILFIVSIGVLNTVLMTILERTKEFGILKAIGTRPSHIFIMIVLETTLITTISIFIGVFFAIAINYKLSTFGIPYPKPIEIGGIALSHLYSEVSFFNIWVPAAVVAISSIGVSIIPAIKAAHIVPVKAIRST